MVGNVNSWIGEVVEITSFDTITLQLYINDFDMIQNPFISIHRNEDEVIYCTIQLFNDSIDKSRKAIALNLNDEELNTEHPEHVFLIKPYLTAINIGTFTKTTFTSGVQKFNLGLHSRFVVTKAETIIKFTQNEHTLNSLLSYITNNPFLKPRIKSICSLWTTKIGNFETKNIILRNLSYLLRNDYFLLKEIAEYINHN